MTCPASGVNTYFQKDFVATGSRCAILNWRGVNPMAFEIGERVTSRFTGPGTVAGEMFKDEDRDCLQRVKFDNAMFGERDWLVKKLEPFTDPPAKKVAVKKSEARSEDVK